MSFIHNRKGGLMMAIAGLLVSLTTWADPSISVTRVQQRYPWNGLVDIDYTVSDVGDDFYYGVDFYVTGKDVSGKDIDVKAHTFLTPVASSNGSYRVTWDSNADGATFYAKGATVTGKLVFKTIATDGDYMIVDLTDGTNAVRWRVSYMSNVADVNETFNTDEYKTDKMVFVKVPAGGFWMGSSNDPDSEFYDDKANFTSADFKENPRHYVQLTKDYFIALFPLTSAQYKNIMGEMTAYDAQNFAGKPMIPATGFSWNSQMSGDTLQKRLNDKATCAGLPRTGFAVPTEAQWERAARAGSTTRYFFGNDPGTANATLKEYAWVGANTYKDVGQLKPNPWGLYDVYGNGFEFVQDRCGVYAEGTETAPVVNPVQKTSGWGCIVRSAANWSSGSADYRSAKRTVQTMSSSDNSFGIRLAFVCE